ncbi:hypothetical protein TI05_10305 [Achromatium sp. WMS3]|nr:hypothetical protein TI05_10305 [Achromatium sp. WMS3]
MDKSPKLRTVEKYNPPYSLNKFPKNFAVDLGKEVVYLITSRGKKARLEGSDWEEIFARLIGANWKPSNVGLDDIVLEQTAWGAKTVKNCKPSSVTKIRLISGRNSPVYSFGEKKVSEVDPDHLGKQVLEIWNERVTGIRKIYRHVRTIVLIKSYDLLELAVFEFDTIIYPVDQFWWQWNKRNNLEGFNKSTNQHIFTWQPHGSQFTIIESVPKERLVIKIREPPLINKDEVLQAIKFDKSWITVL